jgi:energy-coupling factor transport system substrate-specific component
LFTYPFFAAVTPQQVMDAGGSGAPNPAASPLAAGLVIALCLAAVVVEAQGQAMSAKLVALLGVLLAINSVLRLAETALPGPGGFTPIFMLVILAGYVFGPRFGFLMGALSLLVSSLVTAGIGPWLPHQMFTAGWMGLSAGWLGQVMPRLRARRAPAPGPAFLRPSRAEIVVLIVFGTAWGFAYGAIMNLWFWPFQSGDAGQTWQAGMSAGQAFQRYAVFYAATSLIWDTLAAIGNAVLLWLFGVPTLKALRRFKSRFLFQSKVESRKSKVD